MSDSTIGTTSMSGQMSHAPSIALTAAASHVPAYFERKRLWMRLLAAMLLVGMSPIILLTVILVRITSAGPAFFRQTRLGKDGKRFDVIKIRTMYIDAEKLSGPALCMPGDSRITPVGKLLRFLHLDELPQLINVVRGEMCLVGPRPERPAIIARHRLNEIVPGFAERTAVLPGVTGLAQINLPPDQSPECVIPKVKLDLEYIATASPGMDFRILLCTAMRMVGIRHGRAAKFLGLFRNAASYRPSAVSDKHVKKTHPREGIHSRHHAPQAEPAPGFTIEQDANYEVTLQRLSAANLVVGADSGR